MYGELSSIRRSKIKQQILRLLGEAKTATDLKKSLNIHRESISRSLLAMEKQNLVKCLNPEQPNFRYCKITEKGKKIIKNLT